MIFKEIRIFRQGKLSAVGVNGVAGERLVSPVDRTFQGAAATIVRDPAHRLAALETFLDGQELAAAGLPACPAAAAVLASWCDAGCSPIPAGCWAAACVLRERQRWPTTLPLVASGFIAHAGRYRPARDDLGWLVAVCDAVERAARRAREIFGEMEGRAGRLNESATAERTAAGMAVLKLARARDSFDAVDVAKAAKVPERTARRVIERLVESGALQELTRRKSYRLYGL